MEPQKKFGPDQRVRRQKTFKNLVENGQFVRGEFFYLWTGRNHDFEAPARAAKPMLGVIVSRKTDPRATGRNFWKRRVREIFRKNQTQLHPEIICVVKVREAPGRPSFATAEKELVRLFKKAGAWA